MKRSNLITGIIYFTAGLLFFALSCMDTPLQSLFCGLAGAGIAPGFIMIYKYIYWSRPDRRPAYQEKMETEKIELHDERKEMLRGKTARYMYAYTLLIIGVSVIIFQILSSLTVIEGGRVVIIYLGALFFSELFLSKWIFRKLERKY